jgi:acetolactate synthase-1/2/3 large subunit
MMPIIERLLQEAEHLRRAGEEFTQAGSGRLSVAALTAPRIGPWSAPAVGDGTSDVPTINASVAMPGRGIEFSPDVTAGTVQADTGAWKSRVSGWREQFPLSYEQSEPGEALKPQFCLEKLRDSAPEDTILVSGVGQHQMWSSQYWRFDQPYTWVNSGGLGTMGFSVPAAVGAKVGRPDATVWAIDGDGCFQMTAQELVTASVERIPVKVAILNNSYLGMVRQWQEMFYDERYSEVYLSPDTPDFVKWAEAMGCVGIRVDSPEEVQPAIDKANSIDDRPVVVDFRVDAREKVFPMVPAGFSNDDVVLPASQEINRKALR